MFGLYNDIVICRYHRHSIRLPKHDYSSDGWYFVTIGTYGRQCIFGEIINNQMELNDFGRIINDVWQTLPKHHNVKLDVFQIMPNHFHGIIFVGAHPCVRPVTVGAHHDAPNINGITNYFRAIRSYGAIRESPLQKQLQKRSSLSKIIGYFKMNSSKSIHDINPNLQVWQRNYYEHIIRNENELIRVTQYIQMNPQMWNRDRNNPNVYCKRY